MGPLSLSLLLLRTWICSTLCSAFTGRSWRLILRGFGFLLFLHFLSKHLQKASIIDKLVPKRCLYRLFIPFLGEALTELITRHHTPVLAQAERRSEISPIIRSRNIELHIRCMHRWYRYMVHGIRLSSWSCRVLCPLRRTLGEWCKDPKCSDLLCICYSQILHECRVCVLIFVCFLPQFSAAEVVRNSTSFGDLEENGLQRKCH